jgi:hypothetical protein
VHKKKFWLSKRPADDLEKRLARFTPATRDQALRYFLEFSDKGVSALSRRNRKVAARYVLHAVEDVERYVDPEDREQALHHIRVILLAFAVRQS